MQNSHRELKPPVDLHWFFEISISAFFSNWDKNSVSLYWFFFSSHWNFFSVQTLYNWIFIPVWNECWNGYFKKPVEINRGIECWEKIVKLLKIWKSSWVLCQLFWPLWPWGSNSFNPPNSWVKTNHISKAKGA